MPPAWEAPRPGGGPAPVPEEPEGGAAAPEEDLSQQEKLFRQTEAMRQQAMKAAMAAHKEGRGFSSQRIYGTRQIKKAPKPMNTLELDMGVVTVEGGRVRGGAPGVEEAQRLGHQL